MTNRNLADDSLSACNATHASLFSIFLQLCDVPLQDILNINALQ